MKSKHKKREEVFTTTGWDGLGISCSSSDDICWCCFKWLLICWSRFRRCNVSFWLSLDKNFRSICCSFIGNGLFWRARRRRRARGSLDWLTSEDGNDRLASADEDEPDDDVVILVDRRLCDGGNGGYEGNTGVLLLEKLFAWRFFNEGELADEWGNFASFDEDGRGGEDESGGGTGGTATDTWEFELAWFWHLIWRKVNRSEYITL